MESSELLELKLLTIAAQLGLSLLAVKSRVQGAVKMIKNMFIACCAFTLDEKDPLRGENKEAATKYQI
jgi:hypothetical protein